METNTSADDIRAMSTPLKSASIFSVTANRLSGLRRATVVSRQPSGPARIRSKFVFDSSDAETFFFLPDKRVAP